MKVLFVTNMWPTYGQPAAGSFVVELHRALTSRNIEVDVFALRPDQRGPARYLVGMLELSRYLRGKRFDVIHAHYGLTVAVALVAAGSSQTVVGSFCGSDLYKARQRPISRWAGRRAHAAIVMTSEMRDLLQRDDAAVLPYPIDVDLFRRRDRLECREALGMDPSALYVLFPYNPQRREKRFGLASEAVRVAQSRTRQQIHLLVVHGRSRADYAQIVSACDALLLTSMWEGSPNAPKEFLACDIPVVSVDVGDVRRILEGIAGCSIRLSDPSDLAEGILHAFKYPATLGGRERALEHSHSAVAPRVMDLYAEVLA